MTDQPAKSKTRQYLTIAVVLLLLSVGISMIYKATHPENGAETIVGDVHSENIVSEFENHPEDQTLNDIIDTQDSDLTETSSPKEEASVIGEDAVIDEDEAETDEFAAKGSTKTIKPEPIQKEEVNKVVISKYMVIAGSYSTIENARKGLERTILSGFQEAEIVQFKNSKYHTVCALRSDNEQKARAAVAQLKAKSIDAFLHVSRFGK